VNAQIEHYVSQFLLERFRLPGRPLECYDIDKERWVRNGRSPLRACSSKGYHQHVLAAASPGTVTVDDALEAELQQAESMFASDVLPLLDAAVDQEATSFPPAVYQALCRYCAFLHLISPAAKAAVLPAYSDAFRTVIRF
jgi:hypothetical protein